MFELCCVSNKHRSTTYISKTTNAQEQTFQNKRAKHHKFQKQKKQTPTKIKHLYFTNKKSMIAAKTDGKPEETTTPVDLTHLTFG